MKKDTKFWKIINYSFFAFATFMVGWGVFVIITEL